ncbi:hypothetical protein BDF20DRAFT_888755 [Mycotypha africana]|uniref:uncharacterized protein n=1 Tax=Mycotypha africana TaxID=64632 RepID=UPI0023006B82|nr:uncharacterized protein BDF20DRAFT_888755 [Mycotypha africana]KAI8969977.1 hypothetical protein BDF20DRAFT_888755 [Mycotypha africana]
MVMISSPRYASPLMAESSFKRKIIGWGARALKAIPVIRPQDLASEGVGKLIVKADDKFTLYGEGTQFKRQVAPRDTIVISKSRSISYQIEQVISDTEIKLKQELSQEAINFITHANSSSPSKQIKPYKIIPHVDQSVLYEKVTERLTKGESIVIFPEGGSHDRLEMLPLKAGFAIMALNAVAKNEHLNVKIVPVGLNYFHPHRFRSRAVVSYGAPISVSPNLVEAYQRGGADKRAAIASLLDEGYEALKSVTVNAPDYDRLMIIATARRLYKPADEHKLTIDQVVELNRRFLLGYTFFEKDPRLVELARCIQAYNNTLKYFGLRDYQIAKSTSIAYNDDMTVYSASLILLSRVMKLLFLAIFGFPALLINSPIIILSLIISQKKQKEALAGSSVKIAARDVLATWKILVAVVGIPSLYGFYSVLLFAYLYVHEYSHAFSLSLLVWVLLPFVQYMCVLLLENSIDIYKSLYPLFLSLFNPDGLNTVRKMRENLSETITKFIDENGSIALKDFDKNKFDKLELHEKVKSRKLMKDMEEPATKGLLRRWFDDKYLFFSSKRRRYSYEDNGSSSSDINSGSSSSDSETNF